jgi:hypothetical protein
MATCLVCNGVLVVGKRRRICIEAKAMLKCFLSESDEDESTVERFLKENEFVCKSKCLLMVENAVKIQKKCKESFKVLGEKVLNTYKDNKFSCRMTVMAKRRISPDSPPREVLSQPIAGSDTPTVSVSFIIVLAYLYY